MECNNQVGLALAELKPLTFTSCWKNIWPECVKSKEPVIYNNDEFADIIIMVPTIDGDGFGDLPSAGLEALLVDKSLTKNEIIDLTLNAYHEREHSDYVQEVLPVLNAILIKKGLDEISTWTEIANDILQGTLKWIIMKSNVIFNNSIT